MRRVRPHKHYCLVSSTPFSAASPIFVHPIKYTPPPHTARADAAMPRFHPPCPAGCIREAATHAPAVLAPQQHGCGIAGVVEAGGVLTQKEGSAATAIATATGNATSSTAASDVAETTRILAIRPVPAVISVTTKSAAAATAAIAATAAAAIPATAAAAAGRDNDRRAVDGGHLLGTQHAWASQGRATQSHAAVTRPYGVSRLVTSRGASTRSYSVSCAPHIPPRAPPLQHAPCTREQCPCQSRHYRHRRRHHCCYFWWRHHCRLPHFPRTPPPPPPQPAAQKRGPRPLARFDPKTQSPRRTMDRVAV